MKVRREHIKLAVACFAIGILIGVFVAQTSNNTTFTLSQGIYPGAPSYTIWREGSTYYAKDAYGAIDFSGTNASQVYHDVLDSLSSGTIFFAQGTFVFPTPLLIKSDITLDGTGSGSNIEISQSGWRYIITNENPTVVSYDKRFCIQNLKLTNQTSGNSETDRWNSTNRAAILIRNATEVTIRNLIIKTKLPSVNLENTTYSTIDNIEADGGIGLTYSSSKNRVTNNKIHGVTDGNAITISGYLDYYSHDNIIDSNTVVDTSGLGITVDDGSYGNIISNNYVQDTSGDAINAEAGAYENIYANNRIYNGRLSIAGNSTYPCWNNIAEGNIIVNPPSDGIYLNYAHRTQVINNKVIGSSLNGILIANTNDPIVNNNYVESSENDGIKIQDSVKGIYSGNRAFDPADSPTQDYGIRETGTSNYNIIIGCWAQYNTVADIIVIGANTQVVASYNGTTWIP